MLETIGSMLYTFMVFHVNGFYSILHFLKNHYFILFVLVAVGFMVFEELKVNDQKYVNDERRMT